MTISLAPPHALLGCMLTLLLIFSTPLSATPSQTFVVQDYLRAGKQTALDDYIRKPDSSYQWALISHSQYKGYSTYIVDMTSQSWRNSREVSRTKWQHWLTLVMPDKPCSDTAMLLISGGNNGGTAPKKASQKSVEIVKTTGCAVAELGMVPNQRLSFHGETTDRTEDGIVAYTWNQYLDTGDSNWPARMPMVKSAVRAMDTLQSLMQQQGKPDQQLREFVVAGASKRGWTTWLTGAVDSRVKAIAPIVIDILNVDASMRHHYAAYGFWAPAVGDYVRQGIFQRMDDPKSKELYQLIDPFTYLDRLSLPKMIINGSSDQFFLPDSSQFYFDKLPGEKHIRYVANNDHRLGNSDATSTLAAFFKAVATDQPRPNIDWRVDSTGSIHLTSDRQPKQVTLWQAHNALARDFRLEMKEVYDNGFTATSLVAQQDGSYIGTAAANGKGWTAYFIEVEFSGANQIPMKFTTEVEITPDVLPFAEKDPSKDKKIGPPAAG